MAITIDLPISLEEKIRQAAAESGTSINGYIVQLLSKSKERPKQKKQLSEAELLEKITLSISEKEWIVYRHLVALRRGEKMNEEEYNRLVLLGEKIEKAGVKRLNYLIQLADLRKVTLNKVIADLGIEPVEV